MLRISDAQQLGVVMLTTRSSDAHQLGVVMLTN